MIGELDKSTLKVGDKVYKLDYHKSFGVYIPQTLEVKKVLKTKVHTKYQGFFKKDQSYHIYAISEELSEYKEWSRELVAIGKKVRELRHRMDSIEISSDELVDLLSLSKQFSEKLNEFIEHKGKCPLVWKGNKYARKSDA